MWDSKSGRTSPLPAKWKFIRANVLRRDNYRCVQIREDTGLPCGARATDVDHIDSPDDHSHKNLRSLCSWHHNQKTAGQGGKAAAKKKNRITTEAHPGFLPVED